MGDKNVPLWDICNKTQRWYADIIGADWEIITPREMTKHELIYKHHAYSQTVQIFEYAKKIGVLYINEVGL